MFLWLTVWNSQSVHVRICKIMDVSLLLLFGGPCMSAHTAVASALANVKN